jgi:hypothetical protein
MLPGFLRTRGILSICPFPSNTQNSEPLTRTDQDDLNEIAEGLNNRPRKGLTFSPNEVFAQLVAEAQATGQQCCASSFQSA